MLKQKKFLMTKNIVYFGEQSLFSDTLKNLIQLEGANFYDFSLWDDCAGQFSDLSPSFIFIDLDTFDPSSLSSEVEEFECVFFKSLHDEELSWNSNFYLQSKPLEVIKFKEFLEGLLYG